MSFGQHKLLLKFHAYTLQAEVLNDFLSDIQSGKFELDADAEQGFYKWREQRIKEDIDTFAKEWGLDSDILHKSFVIFDPKTSDNVPRLDEIIDSVKNEKDDPFMLRLNLMQRLPEWMKELKRKYAD